MVQEKQTIVPEISVIMSVFNGQDYLSEAIESILNQSFTNFEFIIINDASIDRSKEIIELYKDPRIVIITNDQTLGLAKSLNRALKIAKGNFIARMDADDIAIYNRLEIQFKNSVSLDVDVLGASVDAFSKDGNVERWNFPETFPEIFLNGLYSPPFAHPAVFARKSVMLNFMYNEDCLYAQDYELWSRMLFEKNIIKVVNLKESALKYRIHDNQVSTDKKAIQQNIRLNVFKNNLKHLGINVAYDESFILSLLSNSTFDRSHLKTLIGYLKQLKKSNKFDAELLAKHTKKMLLRFSFESSGSRIGRKLGYYYSTMLFNFA